MSSNCCLIATLRWVGVKWQTAAGCAKCDRDTRTPLPTAAALRSAAAGEPDVVPAWNRKRTDRESLAFSLRRVAGVGVMSRAMLPELGPRAPGDGSKRRGRDKSQSYSGQ